MSQVVVVLGSESDKNKVERSGMVDIFETIGISYDMVIISAHRNPQELAEFCVAKEADRTLIYIAVAGMAAALPGVIASHLRHRPVIGVPLSSDLNALDGLDALLSMVRMPSLVPVAVAGMNETGLRNAALLACQIIALSSPALIPVIKRFIENNTKPPQYYVTLKGQEGKK